MKRSLKTQLSSSLLLIVLLTVGTISLLANYFINRQFTAYITGQQKLKTQIITSSMSQQYTPLTSEWNMDYVHAVGMYSLYEGYIVKVYDINRSTIWDAQSHDMKLCHQVMDEISSRMAVEYPELEGDFTATEYPLSQGREIVGYVSISYFGPFFLNENDFRFLQEMNTILVSVGLVSLAVSLFVGILLARRISKPILKTVEMTKQIAEGHYEVRLKEESHTKELELLEGSINHLAVSLETLEKLRKQLTEDVAHEIRTPITILSSYLEAMTEGIWEVTPERLRSCNDEAVRIGKLVGDLEKLAKIESDSLKLEREQLDLYELLEKTVCNFEEEIRAKDLKVSISGPHIRVWADRDRIRQVAVNLMTNGIKYSKEGSSILVELFETEDTTGFRVKDSGIGIRKEELPYIFERFYRADKSRNRSTGGSGIGLTIVKAIVEAHGGRVIAESEAGKGSTFTVVLPKD